MNLSTESAKTGQKSASDISPNQLEFDFQKQKKKATLNLRKWGFNKLEINCLLKLIYPKVPEANRVPEGDRHGPPGQAVKLYGVGPNNRVDENPPLGLSPRQTMDWEKRHSKKYASNG